MTGGCAELSMNGVYVLQLMPTYRTPATALSCVAGVALFAECSTYHSIVWLSPWAVECVGSYSSCCWILLMSAAERRMSPSRKGLCSGYDEEIEGWKPTSPSRIMRKSSLRVVSVPQATL